MNVNYEWAKGVSLYGALANLGWGSGCELGLLEGCGCF